MINDNLLSVTGGDLITYLNGSEGTATSVNQAWMDYLTREGYTTGTLNDRLYNKLRDDGFTGTLADMLTGFWSTPQVNYVARLNGADQYWQLSEDIVIPQGVDYKIYIDTDLSASNGDVVQTYMGSGDPNTDFWWYRNGTDVKSCVVRFFDSEFVSFTFSEAISGEVSVESDGANLTIESNGQRVSRPSSLMLDGFSISLIGYRGYYAYAKGAMKDFKVEINGVLTHSIPLTNKAQGATQLATVGNVNATMVNYTEAVWEVLPELWYNKTTGMVICSDKLIECNDEVIPCL